jgi:hypothetical protein
MDAVVRKYRSRGDLTPLGGNVIIQERDERFFKALNYHGPLSVPYLYNYVVDDFPDTTLGSLSVRLNTLTTKGKYRLDRPGQRFRTVGINKFEIYANSQETDDYLIDRNLTPRRSISISKFNFHHETFLAHITASIELAARKSSDHTFLNEFELLPRVPSGTRIMPCEIAHDFKLHDDNHIDWKWEKRASHRSLQPDAYFALKKSGKYCAFFLEADCGTEPLTRGDLDQKSWLATLLKYIRIIDGGYYKQHFGLTCGALVLIVCTSKRQMEGIQRILLQITGGKGKSYFLFKTWHEFDDELFVPKQVNYALLNDPWSRAGYDPLYI